MTATGGELWVHEIVGETITEFILHTNLHMPAGSLSCNFPRAPFQDRVKTPDRSGVRVSER
jgi:hypothetical protein